MSARSLAWTKSERNIPAEVLPQCRSATAATRTCCSLVDIGSLTLSTSLSPFSPSEQNTCLPAHRLHFYMPTSLACFAASLAVIPRAFNISEAIDVDHHCFRRRSQPRNG